MQVSLTGSLLRIKKGMVLKEFPFHTACGDPQICFFPRMLCTCRRNKKVPKDCHAYTWYPLTLLTILNSVCPGSPKRSRNLPVAPKTVLSPFPIYRFRIKINYGLILTQYLVSCQLKYTIYSISFCCFFNPEKFFIFFIIFQVFIPSRIFTL